MRLEAGYGTYNSYGQKIVILALIISSKKILIVFAIAITAALYTTMTSIDDNDNTTKMPIATTSSGVVARAEKNLRFVMRIIAIPLLLLGPMVTIDYKINEW